MGSCYVTFLKKFNVQISWRNITFYHLYLSSNWRSFLIFIRHLFYCKYQSWIIVMGLLIFNMTWSWYTLDWNTRFILTVWHFLALFKKRVFPEVIQRIYNGFITWNFEIGRASSFYDAASKNNNNNKKETILFINFLPAYNFNVWL